MLEGIFAPLVSTPWGYRLGWGVFISMAILCAVTMIEAVEMWRLDMHLAQKAIETKLSPVVMDQGALFIAKLPELHLFGKEIVADSSAGIPLTSLQLRLLGVIAAIPKKYSRVIISEAGQPGKVYQIGDSLPSGVVIYSITRDGVVLDNAGRLEKLELERPGLLFQGMPKPLLGGTQ